MFQINACKPQRSQEAAHHEEAPTSPGQTGNVPSPVGPGWHKGLRELSQGSGTASSLLCRPLPPRPRHLHGYKVRLVPETKKHDKKPKCSSLIAGDDEILDLDTALQDVPEDQKEDIKEPFETLINDPAYYRAALSKKRLVAVIK